MPPIHWVSLRQKRMLGGIVSTESRMVAPVVVRPEAVSNRASTNEGMVSDSRYGNAPSSVSATQASATAA